MAYSEISAPCRGCQQDRPFRRHRPEHLLHFVLTVFTGGMWLLAWGLAAFYPGAYRCAACGSKYAKPRQPRSPWLLVFGLIAVFLLLMGLFRGFTSNSPTQPVAISPPAAEAPALPTTISAAELLKTFRTTPHTAEARYADAELTVSGEARLATAAEPGRQSWLVFVSADGKPLVQCLTADEDLESLRTHFAGRPTAPITIRCRFLGYSPDGSLTLHRPELTQ